MTREGPALVIAHKGYHKDVPGNTLESLLAAEKNNFDGVEIDLRKTKDGAIIVFHSKKTIQNIEIEKETYDQIEKIDILNDASSSTQKIPTFEKLIKNSDTLLIAELKEPGMEEEVADIIRKNNAYNTIYISSFNPVSLYLIKKYDPKVHIVFNFGDKNFNPKNISKNTSVEIIKYLLPHKLFVTLTINILKPDLLGISYKEDAAFITRIQESRVPFFLWTPNKKDSIEEALKQNPYGIISDNPKLVRKIIENQD